MSKKRRRHDIHFGKAHFHAEKHCATCGHYIDASTPVNTRRRGMTAQLHPGAFCVRLYCGELNVVGDDMELRKPDYREVFDMMMNQPDEWNMIQGIRRAAKSITKRKESPKPHGR